MRPVWCALIAEARGQDIAAPSGSDAGKVPVANGEGISERRRSGWMENCICILCSDVVSSLIPVYVLFARVGVLGCDPMYRWMVLLCHICCAFVCF